MYSHFKKYALTATLISIFPIGGYTAFNQLPQDILTDQSTLQNLNSVIKSGTQIRLNAVNDFLNSERKSETKFCQSDYDTTKELWTIMRTIVTDSQDQSTCDQAINSMNTEGPRLAYFEDKAYNDFDPQQAAILQKILVSSNKVAAGIMEDFVMLQQSKSLKSSQGIQNYLNQCASLYMKLIHVL